MKKIMTAIYLIFSSFLLLSSCKKDATIKPISIVGKWTLTESGSDNNQNGILDAGETSVISGYVETLDLKADRSVEIIYKSVNTTDTLSGTYVYENNTLRVSAIGLADEVNDVLSLTTDKLIIRSNSSSPSSFGVLKR